VKGCGLVSVMVLWFVVKKSRSDRLVINIEMMAMSMRMMLHRKSDISEVAVVRGKGCEFQEWRSRYGGRGQYLMLCELRFQTHARLFSFIPTAHFANGCR
jgi:hypothetical protein